MDILIQLAYVVSAALFIYGLKQLGSPATARRGNMISSLGMLLAIVAGALGILTTLLCQCTPVGVILFVLTLVVMLDSDVVDAFNNPGPR